MKEVSRLCFTKDIRSDRLQLQFHDLLSLEVSFTVDLCIKLSIIQNIRPGVEHVDLFGSWDTWVCGLCCIERCNSISMYI